MMTIRLLKQQIEELTNQDAHMTVIISLVVILVAIATIAFFVIRIRGNDAGYFHALKYSPISLGTGR
jgi:hypothetical protein